MTSNADGPDGQSAGPILATWMALIVLMNGAAWASGQRGAALAVAVERGAATVEERAVGEVAESAVREAIEDQRASLRFWAAVAAVGDFVVEPIAPAVRAAVAASLFAAIAALRGRPTRFGEAMAGAAVAQGFWVLGLGVRVALMAGLDRPGAETSATLLLPPGAYPAIAWVALRQVDPFAMIGWAAVARTGWRLGLVGPVTAAGTCLVLWGIEATVRLAAAAGLGAAMRAVLLPA